MKCDITFHPQWWYKNANIDFSQSFFDDPVTRIESDKKMRKVLFEKFSDFGLGEENPQPRPLLGTNYLAAGYLHSEILGCNIQYAPDNSPVVLHAGLDIDELDRDFEYSGLENSKVWLKVEAQIEFLQKEYGAVESYINLMGVQNIAMDLIGQDLMVAYYDEPEGIQKVFSGITDCLFDTGKRLKELNTSISEGVTAIIGQSHPEVYLTSNCSCEMIPNNIYEEFLLEYDNRLAKEFKHFGIHHCGATMEHVLERYKKVQNIEFLEVGAGSDVTEVRKAFPNTFLNLRVSPVKLNDLNEKELEKLINDLVEAGTNPNKQVSVSCVGIDSSVNDDKLKSFLKICDLISL